MSREAADEVNEQRALEKLAAAEQEHAHVYEMDARGEFGTVAELRACPKHNTPKLVKDVWRRCNSRRVNDAKKKIAKLIQEKPGLLSELVRQGVTAAKDEGNRFTFLVSAVKFATQRLSYLAGVEDPLVFGRHEYWAADLARLGNLKPGEDIDATVIISLCLEDDTSAMYESQIDLLNTAVERQTNIRSLVVDTPVNSVGCDRACNNRFGGCECPTGDDVVIFDFGFTLTLSFLQHAGIRTRCVTRICKDITNERIVDCMRAVEYIRPSKRWGSLGPESLFPTILSRAAHWRYLMSSWDDEYKILAARLLLMAVGVVERASKGVWADMLDAIHMSHPGARASVRLKKAVAQIEKMNEVAGEQLPAVSVDAREEAVMELDAASENMLGILNEFPGFEFVMDDETGDEDDSEARTVQEHIIQEHIIQEHIMAMVTRKKT